MSTASDELKEEITAGNRPIPVTNEEWNQQTIVDARNVVHTQQSTDGSQQYNEQRSIKSILTFFFILFNMKICFF